MAGTDQNKWHFSLYFSENAKNNGQLTHLIYKFYYICLQIVSADRQETEKIKARLHNGLKHKKPNW